MPSRRHTIITGHSGAGKTTLARSFGLPVHALDDDPDIRAQLEFQKQYREQNDGRLPIGGEHTVRMRAAEHAAIRRALALKAPHAIEGSYFLSTRPSAYRRHDLHLVDVDPELAVRQRVERQRLKDIARGKGWSDERAEGVAMRGRQLVEEYAPGVARWRKSKHVTKHTREHEKAAAVFVPRKRGGAVPTQHTLVTGHSGAGKSTLARSFGLPIHALDDDPDIHAQIQRQKEYASRNGGRLPSLDNPEYNKAMQRAERRAIGRALALADPHVIEGAYLLNRRPAGLRAHKLHLVDVPQDVVLAQRVERERQKDLAKGLTWSDERAAGVRMRGQQLIDEYEPGVQRWRAAPYVTKHRRDAMNPSEKRAEVEYRGHTFPGYNQPIQAGEGKHKMMVLAKKGDDVKLVRFGHRGYRHNYSPEAKANYLKRSAGIRDGSGNLTKDDKFSANYWARKHLWPRNQEADGSALHKEASMHTEQKTTHRFARTSKKAPTAQQVARARIALVRASRGGEESVSNAIARAYAEELRKGGYDVDEIDLEGVPYADDWDDKYKKEHQERLRKAHATVYATPVYNWGPSARLSAYVQNTIKSGQDPYRPYGVLGAAGSSRSQGYLHSLQNTLAMEDRGINVGAPLVATEGDVVYSGDRVTGVGKAYRQRLAEHAAVLGGLAKQRMARNERVKLSSAQPRVLLRKHLLKQAALPMQLALPLSQVGARFRDTLLGVKRPDPQRTISPLEMHPNGVPGAIYSPIDDAPGTTPTAAPVPRIIGRGGQPTLPDVLKHRAGQVVQNPWAQMLFDQAKDGGLF